MFNSKNFEEYNEYDELEKVYKKRKIKKYLYGGIVTLIVVVGGYFIISNSSAEKKSKTTPSVKKEQKQKVQEKVTNEDISAVDTSSENKKKEQTKEKKENKLTLNPIIPEVNNVESLTKREDEFKKPAKEEEKKETEKKKITKKSENEEKAKIVIKVRTDDYSLKELIDNYNSFPTYETAIRIAKIYFNNGRYEDAIDWAKKANNIDSKKEESWLLYAKSLVNLGNVKTAKKLLNAYMNIYGKNKKIEEYLRTLK